MLSSPRPRLGPIPDSSTNISRSGLGTDHIRSGAPSPALTLDPRVTLERRRSVRRNCTVDGVVRCMRRCRHS